jgi:hypothetical protein
LGETASALGVSVAPRSAEKRDGRVGAPLTQALAWVLLAAAICVEPETKGMCGVRAARSTLLSARLMVT